MDSFYHSSRSNFCCSCCQHRYSLCDCCGLCFGCCCCLPPPMPCLPPPPCIPPIPPLPLCPPRQCPVRIIREQILVPLPYPVYPTVRSSCECDYDRETCRSPCSYRHHKKCADDHHLGTVAYPHPRSACKPFTCPTWPRPKRIHLVGQAVTPGYTGHIPGFAFHAAGRTFGRATKDTRCIMSQWEECCPRLPERIWEQ